MLSTEAFERRNDMATHAAIVVTDAVAPGSLYGTMPSDATQRIAAGLQYSLHPACFARHALPNLSGDPIETAEMGDRVESVVSDAEGAILSHKGRLSIRDAVRQRATILHASGCEIDPELWRYHTDTYRARSAEQQLTFLAFQETRWNMAADRRASPIHIDPAIFRYAPHSNFTPPGESTPGILIVEGDDPTIGPALTLATRLVAEAVTSVMPDGPYTQEDHRIVQQEIIATGQALGLLLRHTGPLYDKVLTATEYVHRVTSSGVLAEFMQAMLRKPLATMVNHGLYIDTPIQQDHGRLRLAPATSEYLEKVVSKYRDHAKPSDTPFDSATTADIGRALFHAFAGYDRNVAQRRRLEQWKATRQ